MESGLAVVVTAVFEVVGVISIAPFIAIISDRSIIARDSVPYLY
jgi:hypothetical protein